MQQNNALWVMTGFIYKGFIFEHNMTHYLARRLFSRIFMDKIYAAKTIETKEL